ncbi:hypothetical protein [Pseudomonas sp. TMP25]|uniref:DUF7210 family protein n=1 Tax=Pseudomonas sp. TMP25 TaxID=3136561 RepID=UPI003101AD97
MSNKPQVAARQPALSPVVLKKPHIHNGEPFKAGSTIQVTDDQLDWLSQQGVIDSQQKHGTDGQA